MKWKKIVRETGLLEYVCEHGIGHPDIRSVHMQVSRYIFEAGLRMKDNPNDCSDGADVIRGKITYSEMVDVWMLHSCDKCCSREDFPGRIKGIIHRDI